MLKHDLLEDKEEYKKIFETIDDEVEKILESRGVKKSLGYTNIFDRTKKILLKEKYSIDWKTLAEMNPDIKID